MACSDAVLLLLLLLVSAFAQQTLVQASPVDVDDAAALRDYFVTQLAAEGVTVKPPELRGTYGKGERLAGWQLGETRDRDDVLKLALDYVLNANGAGTCRPGYAATWASPGSGKTHFLDAIAAAIQADASLRVKFVPIPVTFNGVMNSVEVGVVGLMARIVYAYFVGFCRPSSLPSHSRPLHASSSNLATI